MTLNDFNALSALDAVAELQKCCGSQSWAREMIRRRPFANLEILFERAEEIWFSLHETDWKEAFAHHPRIGEQNLRAKFAATATWAGEEQKGVTSASEEVLHELAQGNREYEAKFGRVFLICATGKSAQDMLDALRDRLHNNAKTEIRIAANEQIKITKIRMEKLFNS